MAILPSRNSTMDDATRARLLAIVARETGNVGATDAAAMTPPKQQVTGRPGGAADRNEGAGSASAILPPRVSGSGTTATQTPTSPPAAATPGPGPFIPPTGGVALPPDPSRSTAPTAPPGAEPSADAGRPAAVNPIPIGPSWEPPAGPLQNNTVIDPATGTTAGAYLDYIQHGIKTGETFTLPTGPSDIIKLPAGSEFVNKQGGRLNPNDQYALAAVSYFDPQAREWTQIPGYVNTRTGEIAHETVTDDFGTYTVPVPAALEASRFEREAARAQELFSAVLAEGRAITADDRVRIREQGLLHLQQLFQSRERLGSERFSTGEREAGEDFQSGILEDTQAFDDQQRQEREAFEQRMRDEEFNFRTRERLSEQDYATTGREDVQRFQEEMDRARQDFERGQQEDAQGFSTSERLGSQQFATGERRAGQQFETSERLGSQDFASNERKASERFTKNLETIRQNFQSSQADLDRAIERRSLELSTGFAYGDVQGAVRARQEKEQLERARFKLEQNDQVMELLSIVGQFPELRNQVAQIAGGMNIGGIDLAALFGGTQEVAANRLPTIQEFSALNPAQQREMVTKLAGDFGISREVVVAMIQDNTPGGGRRLF